MSHASLISRIELLESRSEQERLAKLTALGPDDPMVRSSVAREMRRRSDVVEMLRHAVETKNRAAEQHAIRRILDLLLAGLNKQGPSARWPNEWYIDTDRIADTRVLSAAILRPRGVPPHSLETGLPLDVKLVRTRKPTAPLLVVLHMYGHGQSDHMRVPIRTTTDLQQVVSQIAGRYEIAYRVRANQHDSPLFFDTLQQAIGAIKKFPGFPTRTRTRIFYRPQMGSPRAGETPPYVHTVILQWVSTLASRPTDEALELSRVLVAKHDNNIYAHNYFPPDERRVIARLAPKRP